MIEAAWPALLTAVHSALAAAGMLGAAWGLGRLLIVLVAGVHAGDRLPALGLGLGALAHLWFALGLAGGYRAVVAWPLWAAGLAVLIVEVTRATRQAVARRAGPARPPRPLDERWLQGMAAALGTVLLIGALVPPFGIDTLRHHLDTAKLFVTEGRLAFAPTGFAARPMAGEMFYVWGLLLATPIAGKLVIATHGLLAAWAVARLAERHGDRQDGLRAAVVFLAITEVWFLGLDGKVDAVMLMHLALALYCLDVGIVERTRAFLVLAGVFAGFAMSSALVGLYAAVALAAIVAARLVPVRSADLVGACDAWCMRATRGAGFLLASALVGAPWYVRAWYETGDPFWPVLFPLTGGVDGSAAAHRAAQDVLAAFAPLGRDASGFVRGLGGMIAGAAMLFRRSLVGPLFLAGIPLLALDGRVARRTAWLLAFAAVYYAIWFPFVQWHRLLLPAFVALSGAAAVGLGVGASQGRLARLAVRCAVAGWGLTSLGLALSLAPTFGPVLVGREPLDDFLGRRTSYHADVRWMNTHLPAGAVVASEYPGLYYLDRRSIWLDGFQGFVDYARLDGVTALRAALARWKVTHLFLTTEDTVDAAPEARLRHALAAACGETIYRNPAAVDVTSIVLDQRERVVATVVALRARCDGTGR